MAAALSTLTEDEYLRREPAIDDVRVLFKPSLLREWGRGWKSEQPAFADPAGWPILLEKQMNDICPDVAAVAVTTAGALSADGLASIDDGVGVESLSNYQTDDDDEDDDYEN